MPLGTRWRDTRGRAYTRPTRIKERKERLQKWADYLDEMKSYKIFQSKWKSNFGKLMQAPDEALLRKVMNECHSANASNFFYVPGEK